MLKIRDDIDLKELEKYGFALNNNEWFSLDIKGATVQIKPFTREILIDSYSTILYHNPAILYDLIKDGLVEKVDDK